MRDLEIKKALGASQGGQTDGGETVTTTVYSIARFAGLSSFSTARLVYSDGALTGGATWKPG